MKYLGTKRAWKGMGGEVSEWYRKGRKETRMKYQQTKNREKKKLEKNRGSRGNKISKIEMKKKKKQTQGTSVRKAVRAQEGRISSRGSSRRTDLGYRYLCHRVGKEDRGWDPENGRMLVTPTGGGGPFTVCMEAKGTFPWHAQSVGQYRRVQ